MFDFTGEIPLDGENYSLYKRLRATVYLLAFLTALYLSFVIIFPTQYFSFSFPNPNSTKNTIISPRDKDGNFADRGRMSGKDGIFFDTATPGNFSQAQVTITLDDKSEIPEDISISAKKSYQAFFYPEGSAIDGQTLLDNDPEKLPDGSLVSYGNSVYALGGNSIYPIDSVETFNFSGFSWNDVTPVSSDKISAYEKGKLFSIRSPHPDGTILADESNEWYLIRDGKKHPLSSSARTVIKRNPVLVSSQGLFTTENCRMKKNTLSLQTYSCSLPLEKFKPFFGKDYEFTLNSDTDLKLEMIEVNFETSANWNNMKLAFSDILTNIRRNYGEPTQ